MTLINFPTTIIMPLPRYGEYLVIGPDGDRLYVTGLNRDRGFNWTVGSFDNWRDAIDAARAHRAEEISIHHQMRRGAL